MTNYNFDKEKLNEYLNTNNLKSAKEYLIIMEDFSSDEAIVFLHKYVHENNIKLKKASDINIGYKNLALLSFSLIIIIIVLATLSFSVIRGIINSGFNPSNILFMVVLTISFIGSVLYFIVSILDLFSKNSLTSSGYYSISLLKSSTLKSFLLKFENGESIIISHKLYDTLKNYNYCTIERFKYSKLIKNITNIK